MKKLFTLFFIILGSAKISCAQTTAMDFNMSDCAGGKMHHLFDELDSGNAVIMEFFMDNCSPCIDAGKALEPMYQHLKTVCGNKIRFFQTAFNNTYSCQQVAKWTGNNGFPSVPFDSGAVQVAYYGGFGMPTVVVAAGSAHQVLYLANQGFPAGDTVKIDSLIANFCAGGAGVNAIKNIFSFNFFPKPTSDNFIVSFISNESGNLNMEIENILGRKVKLLVDEGIQAGEWSRTFPSSNLPKGIYFLRAHLNDKPFVEKIIVE